MNPPKAIVVIPIYKEDITEPERMSLIQCCKILNAHDISLICPHGLDIGTYTKILSDFNVKYKIQEFDREFFGGIEGYNLLMLDAGFYKRFSSYDFMLIYQLDAYVFRDDLAYWCGQGYDFIGAPWNEFDFLRNKIHLIEAGVNGGFSLRRIASFINVLSAEGRGKKILENFIRGGRNEDGFFSVEAIKIDPAFKVASFDTAMRFSFERKPEKLYEMTDHKLPFGCHAWMKYDPLFWKNFINP